MDDILQYYPGVQEVLRVVTAAFDPLAEPDENFHRLAKAVVIGALIDRREMHPNDLHQLLAAIQGDYGCWMDWSKRPSSKRTLLLSAPVLTTSVSSCLHRCTWRPSTSGPTISVPNLSRCTHTVSHLPLFAAPQGTPPLQFSARKPMRLFIAPTFAE